MTNDIKVTLNLLYELMKDGQDRSAITIARVIGVATPTAVRNLMTKLTTSEFGSPIVVISGITSPRGAVDSDSLFSLSINKTAGLRA